MHTDFVLVALEQALYARRPERESLIHHSDRGSQYLSIRYSERLAEANIAPSVGSKGDSYDNALAETINGLYKTELINHRAPWDEFTIIVEGLSDPSEAARIAEKIVSSINHPFLVQGSLQAVSTSIGVAYMAAETIDLGVLAKQADAALYQAKNAGRNQYFLSEAGMSSNVGMASLHLA